MRIWYVPFGELDNQRVLGQHNEVHALHTLIVKMRRPWGGLTYEDEDYLRMVHRWSVEEMVRRGIHGHQSTFYYHEPIVQWDDTVRHLDTVTPMDQRQATDRWHLWLRWGGEYKGRIPLDDLPFDAQTDYENHDQMYRLQGGCYHDGSTEAGEGPNRGRELCLLCKRVARVKYPDGTRGSWEERGWSRNG